MTTSATSSGELVESLREILKDTNFLSRQFELTVTTGSAALVSVIDGALVVTGTGVPSHTYLFSNYPTISALVDVLNTEPTYEARLVEDGEPDHQTTDLKLTAPVDVLNQTVVFSSRRWSDKELQGMIERSINRHNMSIPSDAGLQFRGNYNVLTLPSQHYYFVLLLAQIEALKTQIQEGIKRKGTDLSVTDFVALKNALEREYTGQLELFLARKTTPTAEELKDIGSGDVVEGTTYRQSLHTSRRWPWGPHMVPLNAVPMPLAVHLSATAITGGKVTLHWSYNRDLSFSRYEVWRGISRDVSNFSDIVRPMQTVTPTGVRVATLYYRQQTNWIDGAATPVAPGTYYYVVYTVNENNDSTPSNVVIVSVT